MQNQISIFLSFSIINCVIFPLMRKSFPHRYVWKVNHSRKNLPMSGYILCIRFMVSTKICSLHILHTGICAPCTMHCTQIRVGGEKGAVQKLRGKWNCHTSSEFDLSLDVKELIFLLLSSLMPLHFLPSHPITCPTLVSF